MEDSEDGVPCYCMFKCSTERGASPSASSPERSGDVPLNGSELVSYAFTVQLCPNKRVNGKRWSLYSYDEQRRMLERLELKFRPKLAVINKIEFEKSSDTLYTQCHFHAFYFATEDAMVNMADNWNSKFGLPEWRTTFYIPCFNDDGWLQYISKQYVTLLDPSVIKN